MRITTLFRFIPVASFQAAQLRGFRAGATPKRKLGAAFGLTVACVFVSTMFLGCGGDDKGDWRAVKRRQQARHTRTTNVETESFLFDSEDFDLETVVSLIKEDKVKGAEELEKVVNADNGLNNVDTDKDGNVDYVQVKEGRNADDQISLDFMAIPSSSQKEEDALTIASVSFSKSTTSQEVEVSGGYPQYARGYNDHYYHYRRPYRPGLGTAMFMTWLLMPHRPMYYHRYGPSMYYRRPLYSRSMMRQHRTTYRTTSHVSPVKRAARPKSYSVKSANKSRSKFSKSSAGKKAAGFNSRKGAMKKFSARNSNKTKQKATGFGAKKTTKSSGSGWGKKSSGSSGSKSGWGKKSSGSSRSSGFGKSRSSRSSGFGSSRGSSSRRSSGSRSRSRRRR